MSCNSGCFHGTWKPRHAPLPVSAIKPLWGPSATASQRGCSLPRRIAQVFSNGSRETSVGNGAASGRRGGRDGRRLGVGVGPLPTRWHHFHCTPRTPALARVRRSGAGSGPEATARQPGTQAKLSPRGRPTFPLPNEADSVSAAAPVLGAFPAAGKQVCPLLRDGLGGSAGQKRSCLSTGPGVLQSPPLLALPWRGN